MTDILFEIRQLDLALADGDFNPVTVKQLEDNLHNLLVRYNELRSDRD